MDKFAIQLPGCNVEVIGIKVHCLARNIFLWLGRGDIFCQNQNRWENKNMKQMSIKYGM